MGRGTISMINVPKKRKVYGDENFHLTPIFLETNSKGEEVYAFFLRPSEDEEFVYDLEGEFGIGESSFKKENRDAKARVYKNTLYLYYEFDLEKMNRVQKKRIMKWAVDGEV